jgi:hypothetical protein
MHPQNGQTASDSQSPTLIPRAAAAGTTAVDRTGTVAAIALAVVWVGICAAMLARPIFITHDSLSNNVHVSFIADSLRGGHLPLHISTLANGEALTFPYGSVPWLFAAVLWPLLADRAVTVALVVGFAGTVVATFYAFPELRRGWWAAATLANPALVISPLLGQLPFLWGTAFFLWSIGLWRRRRWGWAAAAAAMSQFIHPAVMIPIVAVVALGAMCFEEPVIRRRLAYLWIGSVLVALPAAWAVFQSPVVAQTSLLDQVIALVQTVSMRFLVVAVPLGLAVLTRRALPRWTMAGVTVAFVVLQVPMYQPFGMDFAWGSLWRNPDPSVDAFVDAHGVAVGRTHRVLSGSDGKYGMYAVTEAGGVLDAEFFPEGLHRGGFSTLSGYARFLDARQVQRVVVFPSYALRYRRSNEPVVLEAMVRAGCVEGVKVTPAVATSDRAVGSDAPRWRAYDVAHNCSG